MLRYLSQSWLLSGMLAICALAGTATVSVQPALAQTGAAPPVPGSPSHACHILTSAQNVPDGFGATYNLFSAAKELLLNVECGSSSNATLTVGNDQNTTYIYRFGYEWTGTEWKQITLSGPQQAAADWYVATAKANLFRSQTELTEDNFVVAYTCLWQKNSWKCGCRDTSCSTNHWQLQRFRQQAPSDGGGTASSEHDKLVRAAPGQVSDEYLRSSDMYYLSSEITPAARKTWNDHYEKHITDKVWNQAVPTLKVNINSKTDIRVGGYTQFPTIEPDGVLNFNHLTRWTSEGSPERNYKHVEIDLIRAGSPYITADWLEEGVDYETGFTFWQGGTKNWLMGATPNPGIWQVHGNNSVPMYVVAHDGKIVGFTRDSPSTPFADRKRFVYEVPDKSHEGIHVMKFQFKLGTGGYLRVYHNGKLIHNSGPVNFHGFERYSLSFMNYSSYAKSGVEQIIYMDRLYHRRVK